MSKIIMYSIYTIDETWIYTNVTQSKQQSTVRVLQVESNPTKVIHARCTSKQMVACFILFIYLMGVCIQRHKIASLNGQFRMVRNHLFNRSNWRNKKTSNDTWSFFTMAMRAVTSAQTTQYLTDQSIESMSNPLNWFWHSMIFFCFHT